MTREALRKKQKTPQDVAMTFQGRLMQSPQCQENLKVMMVEKSLGLIKIIEGIMKELLLKEERISIIKNILMSIHNNTGILMKEKKKLIQNLMKTGMDGTLASGAEMKTFQKEHTTIEKRFVQPIGNKNCAFPCGNSNFTAPDIK